MQLFTVSVKEEGCAPHKLGDKLRRLAAKCTLENILEKISHVLWLQETTVEISKVAEVIGNDVLSGIVAAGPEYCSQRIL